MQFVVLGYDGKDDEAGKRRQAVRAEHLEMGLALKKEGHWMFAAGLLNDTNQLEGSMIVCQFESEELLYSHWLDKEPYIIGKVWDRIEVRRAAVPPFFMNQ